MCNQGRFESLTELKSYLIQSVKLSGTFIMRKLFEVWLLSTVLVLSSCTSNPQTQPTGGVIIDTKGLDMSTYYQDLHECRNFAAQVNVGGQVVEKTISGALIGGAVGAIAGDSDAAKRAAGVGGLLGAVKGSGQASQEKQRVLKNCLKGRGYRVLN
jgi:outer membrane lipoprotein SlyB